MFFTYCFECITVLCSGEILPFLASARMLALFFMILWPQKTRHIVLYASVIRYTKTTEHKANKANMCTYCLFMKSALGFFNTELFWLINPLHFHMTCIQLSQDCLFQHVCPCFKPKDFCPVQM